MYSIFDYEYEKKSMDDAVEFFFGDFSTELRNKLLARNLNKPESIYDVFYPSVRNDLLSKNVNKNETVLDESSEVFRNQQLSKIVETKMSLEEDSEEFRKSLLSRNKLHKESYLLSESLERKRKDLLSKNTSSLMDLMMDSESYRKGNLSKNKQVSSDNLEFNEKQINFRDENLNKNIPKEQNLEESSVEFQKDNLSKNKSKEHNLEEQSKSFLETNTSPNTPNLTNAEIDSVQFREQSLAKNTLSETSLDDYSRDFREDNLSFNNKSKGDLITDTESYRKNNTAQNNVNKTDLESDSAEFLKNNLSENKMSDSDLNSDSINYRDDNTAKNKSKEVGLDKESEIYRKNNTSSNEEKASTLEKDSIEFRNKNLSDNSDSEFDLDVESAAYRKNNISANKESENVLEASSNSFRKTNLTKNDGEKIDLEQSSTGYRKTNTSLNEQKISDLEKDSAGYRENVTSFNQIVDTDLEKDSVGYRDGVLSNNSAIETDLDNDSKPYRANNVAGNVPNNSDLDADSVDFRDNNVAGNVPGNSDLDADSVGFRDNNVAGNVPGNSDLDVDSVDFRDNNVAGNVSGNSDLDTDSVDFRDNNVAGNVPGNSDLDADSVDFRDNNVASNVPGNSDLDADSVDFRDNNVANNVPGNSDLDADSVDFRDNNVASNVPSNSDLGNESSAYRNDALSKNEKTNYNLDSYANAQRELNLRKNDGGGMAGVNVLGPGGTSTFVGVSGVWAQGLVFRNLLTLRNKYKLPSKYYSEETLIGEGSRVGLLKDTLNVPSEGNILSKAALPINPAESINQKLSKYQDITSPIERNLYAAYSSAIDQKSDLKYYVIPSDNKSQFYTYNVNYQPAGFNFSNALKTESSGVEMPLRGVDNINRLMRLYLKYSNPFPIEDDIFGDAGVSYESMWAKITELASSGNENTKSIQDLINSYKVFTTKLKVKSLISPEGSYFNSSVEKQFDDSYGQDEKSIAAKTVAGNPFDGVNSGFNGKDPKKGVRKILRDISKSNIEFSENYRNIQGDGDIGDAVGQVLPKGYVIGKTKDGSPKKVYQKYTITNPYAPKGAAKLLFYIKNYSIPEVNGNMMYFPPYISSFQNADEASWNTTNFLGRPEAVYTYNNSSRSGSISFFVLTDYAESVLLGTSQDKEMNPITTSLNKNFTSLNTKATVDEANAKTQDEKGSLHSLQGKKDEESEGINTFASISETESSFVEEENKSSNIVDANTKTTPEQSSQSDAVLGNIVELGESAINIANNLSSTNGYSESSIKFSNIYNNITAVGRDGDGYIDTKVGDTEARILEMIQGELLFQPAFFSGSKVDFKNRMEFLSKLTRPAKNNNNMTQKEDTGEWIGDGGFSFTKPPVCHIRLGDWFDHDVIINGVSFDYADAPWTTNLDGGSVQPMWATVTINFNIVGGAGAKGGVPLTSTDVEGYFGTKTTRR